jgi:hypothetical protein
MGRKIQATSHRPEIILGGLWMSRLNANLRERLGDSY